jgi:transposase
MRYELTDYEWAAIKPMLPNKPRGVPRVNDRRVLNGIFWVLRSGAPWRDLPERPLPKFSSMAELSHGVTMSSCTGPLASRNERLKGED